MCGIGGILRFDSQPPAEESLRAMLAQLHHRGPDGRGLAIHGPCGLVHTRLAILDMRGGHQPMEAPQRAQHGPLTLVFNGEIYNHRQLRKQLETLGHPFASDHCDSEVLLHGYRQWGSELPNHLQGMFAFAIWDNLKQELFLACDRAGKKPMWLFNDQKKLIFGSMPATVALALRHEHPRQPLPFDMAALHIFLRVGYTFENSLIKGLRALPAAHCMTVRVDGQMDMQRYWQPPPVSQNSSAIGAAASALEVITQAVDKRLDADVPLGCFLSGGIDSSIVAALAHRKLMQTGSSPLRTFCARMPAGDFDESEHARVVAAHLGTTHHELMIDATPGQHVMDDLSRLVAVAGEPMADSSLLATYWISRAAREHVHVALSGDGGDELFGGYDRYRAMRWLATHRGWLRHVPQGLLSSSQPRTLRTKLRRLVEAAKHASPAAQYQQMVHLFTLDQIRDLGLGDAGSPAIPHWPDERDPVEAAMRWDRLHYLPYDLLRKVDRASMAVALEVRCPLLDTQVCDFAGRLPHRLLMPRGRPKGLLRQVAGSLVPASIVNRPKRGFAIPIGQWFTGSLRDPLADHLFDGSLQTLGITATQVKRYFDEHTSSEADHTHRLFALLELSLWTKWMHNPLPPAA